MSLITLLILIVVFGLIWYLVSLLPLPAPFKLIAEILIILIAIVGLLGMIGYGPGI